MAPSIDVYVDDEDVSDHVSRLLRSMGFDATMRVVKEAPEKGAWGCLSEGDGLRVYVMRDLAGWMEGLVTSHATLREESGLSSARDAEPLMQGPGFAGPGFAGPGRQGRASQDGTCSGKLLHGTTRLDHVLAIASWSPGPELGACLAWSHQLSIPCFPSIPSLVAGLGLADLVGVNLAVEAQALPSSEAVPSKEALLRAWVRSVQKQLRPGLAQALRAYPRRCVEHVLQGLPEASDDAALASAGLSTSAGVGKNAREANGQITLHGSDARREARTAGPADGDVEGLHATLSARLISEGHDTSHQPEAHRGARRRKGVDGGKVSKVSKVADVSLVPSSASDDAFDNHDEGGPCRERVLGTVEDVAWAIATWRALPLAQALDASQERDSAEAPKGAGTQASPWPSFDGVSLQEARQIVFGPPRMLSDPASKMVLGTYGLPLPEEELCTSASRAASEASRLGFPVRLTLASPDLRIWNAPHFAVEVASGVTQVREVFRRLVEEIESDASTPRLLGVSVAAAHPVHASIWVRAASCGPEDVWMQIGFADAHGRASGDVVGCRFPCDASTWSARVLHLRGASLLQAWRGEQGLRDIHEALFRLARLLHDFPDALGVVRLDPLCLLASGRLEIREACIEVTDAFLIESLA